MENFRKVLNKISNYIDTQDSVAENQLKTLWNELSDAITEHEKKETSGKKRIFEILDQMNQNDSENNTRTVVISSTLISLDKVKQGCKISMGVDDQTMHDVLNEKVISLYIAVDKEVYDKITNHENTTL